MEQEHRISPAIRSAAGIAAAAVPLILLAFGLYGSFSFTFSIPVIWQVAVLGKGTGSLGLKRKILGPAVLSGILTGGIISAAGGYILKGLGMTGYSVDKVLELNNFLRTIGLKVSFRGELGYRLLAAGEEFKWVFLSLLFCVFLVGLGEEIFWRGFIQKKFSGRFSAAGAIWITAVIFGLVHSYLFFIVPLKEGIIFLGLITLAGAFWGYLYEYSGNIWAPAVSHGITAFIVWRYFVFSV